jgi:ketosteroid isomerase-like protein
LVLGAELGVVWLRRLGILVRSMSQENVEIVRRGYELYAAGDLDGVAGLFAGDAELADAGGLGVAGTAAGFTGAGEAVVVPVRISGRGRASGAALDTRLAHLWVLRDGKVIRGDVYRTPEEALEAARKGE